MPETFAWDQKWEPGVYIGGRSHPGHPEKPGVSIALLYVALDLPRRRSMEREERLRTTSVGSTLGVSESWTAPGTLIQELICREVQACEGLIDFEAAGEISPLLSGGRTRYQPAGQMVTSHSQEPNSRYIIVCSFVSHSIMLTLDQIIGSSGCQSVVPGPLA